MTNLCRLVRLLAVLGVVACTSPVQAGIIKDIFQKVTNTNNKTEETVRQSAPICGSGVFSTPNEGHLSPELIFITNRQSRSYSAHERSHQKQDQNNELAQEFSFHAENVSLSELERHGFNPDAPVSFLMHGFTSGYPLQGWISAIVEAYTIDRETSNSGSSLSNYGNDFGSGSENYENVPNSRRDRDRDENGRRRRPPNDSSFGSGSGRHREQSSSRAPPVDHNLFIVNWNYAARGIIYPRAVANIPIVASYVTRFINNKLIDEAGVDPKRIQLIGHSLGAHLAGYIGKNTNSKLGRIYGLDPAGPCFGAIAGPLYPSSKRLAPSDANEVITIQTNSALLGIERPLGRYSVYVEGGANQPGCKSSGVLRSLGTLTFDGGDFDTVACSHSRAPNLITYRHEQGNGEDSCLMIAYACRDWESFTKGQCGVCDTRADRSESSSRRREDRDRQRSPMEPVECLRIGLDWQYPKSNRRPTRPNRPISGASDSNSPFDGQRDPIRPIDSQPNDYETTRRPWQSPGGIGSQSSRRPFSFNNDNDRNRREAKNDDERNDSSLTRSNSSSSFSSLFSALGGGGSNSSRERQTDDNDVEAIQMFMRTSDTQPYCSFHYQLVLELNEPFDSKDPPMSIILQDSVSESERRRGSNGGRKNTLSSDEFGHKFDDRTYTHLLTSYKKLKRIDQATLLMRDGLKDGHRRLKTLHVNYMSHSDPNVRRRWSSRLCPVRTDTDREAITGEGHNRFYFKPCDQRDQYSSGSSNFDRDRDYGNQRDREISPSRGERDHVEHNSHHHDQAGGFRDNERN